jgi:hypothetical protein
MYAHTNTASNTNNIAEEMKLPICNPASFLETSSRPDQNRTGSMVTRKMKQVSDSHFTGMKYAPYPMKGKNTHSSKLIFFIAEFLMFKISKRSLILIRLCHY